MIKDCTYKVCSSSDSSYFRAKFNQIYISPENAVWYKSIRAKLSLGLHMLEGITVITKRPLNCVHALHM